MPPSNSLLSFPDAEEQSYELALMRCERCSLLQTSFDVPPEKLFNDDYPYFSGQSLQWVGHCARYADSIFHRLKLGKDSLVVEIGGNDGTLLKEFPHCHTLNVEPSRSVAWASRQAGIETRITSWERVQGLRADLIVGNNVLAHTPQINQFVSAVSANLKLSGLATFEFPWVVNLIDQTQFDTIYHEHYSYLSLTALEPLFWRHGLQIFEAEELQTHGGSLRIYVRHMRDELANLDGFKAREQELSDSVTYERFRDRSEILRDRFRDFVDQTHGLYAYGAAAKGNTLLNWCGVTQADIEAVGDTTPAKQGKYLPGSHIPVVSEGVMVASNPQTVAILPWNWKQEIVMKLSGKLPDTQFVTVMDL